MVRILKEKNDDSLKNKLVIALEALNNKTFTRIIAALKKANTKPMQDNEALFYFLKDDILARTTPPHTAAEAAKFQPLFQFCRKLKYKLPTLDENLNQETHLKRKRR